MDYKKITEEYEKIGCCKIENFLTPSEVEALRQAMEDVVNDMTDEDIRIHSVYNDPKSKKDEDYYINSGDKISYFFEKDAVDSEGNLLVEDKKKALCKIGYAMHWFHSGFKKFSYSNKIKDLLRHFNYKDPAIVQSMLIFKHPKIGEIVNPHQDSTFLYTEPPTSIGLWFPIEDATLENGCLWYVPGSHKEGIYRRYVRCPGNTPLMSMKGENPEIDDDKYLPIPAKKGDCVLIHGSVFHKSGKNNTNKSRTVYTFHVVDKITEWSKENWLQPTEKLPFHSLYTN